MNIFSILLLVLLMGSALGTAVSRRGLVAVIIYSAFSMVNSVIWILLEAPDLAITQAAVGVGVSCILFYVALQRIDGVHRFDEPVPPDAFDGYEREEYISARKRYPILVVGLGLVIVAVLLRTISTLPPFGAADAPANNEVAARYIEQGVQETGAVNLVAGMILEYRAFDTLGETFVLFTAMCLTLMLLADVSGQTEELSRLEDGPHGHHEDVVVRVGGRLLVPVVMLFGVYVVLWGHVSPGGGFAGGAIIGTALSLYCIAYGFDVTSRFLTRRVFRGILITSLCFYLLVKGWSFIMGANGLKTGIPLGTPGELFSAGLILPLNIAVGAVVSMTIYGLFSAFKRGRV